MEEEDSPPNEEADHITARSNRGTLEPDSAELSKRNFDDEPTSSTTLYNGVKKSDRSHETQRFHTDPTPGRTPAHAESFDEALTTVPPRASGAHGNSNFRSVRSTNRRRMEAKAGRTVLINFIEDDETILEVAKHSKDILYLSPSSIPQLKNADSENQNTDMNYVTELVFDLKRDIWIFIREVPLKDPKLLKMFNFLSDVRKQAMKESNLSLSSFPIQVLLQTYVPKHKLPRESESIRYTKFPSPEPKNLASFLELNYNNRKRKVAHMLGRQSSDPFTEFSIILWMSDAATVTASELPYIRESYAALQEHLEDPNSSFRQQLHHWHKIPNVRVVDVEEKKLAKGTRFRKKMVVEVRPLQLQGFKLLAEQIKHGSLAAAVKQNLLVKREDFTGMVSVEMDDAVMARMSEVFGESEGGECVAAVMDGMSVQHQNEPLSLSRLIVAELYKRHLEDPTKLPFDFQKLLKEQGCTGLIDKIKSIEGRNAMHMAIIAGREDFLKMLFFMNKWGDLRGGVIKPASSPAQKHIGFTPRRLAEAMAFTTKGQDVLNQYDHLENLHMSLSTLAKAALSGQLDLIKIIVSADPGVLKEGSENGLSALACASGAGHSDIVRFLIEKDAKVETAVQMSCTKLAVMFGHVDIIKELEKRVVDLPGRRNGDGLNAIDYCIMNGLLNILRLFRDRNFSITAKSLILAVKHGRTEMLTFLLEGFNLDVNAVADKEKKTALHQAVLSGSVPMMGKLLEHGAEVSCVDKLDRNVLHTAAEFNQLESLNILLHTAKENGKLPTLINSQDIYTGKDIYYLIRGRDRGRRAWHWLELRRMNLYLFKKAMSQGQLDVADHGKVLYSGFGPSPDKDTNDKMQAKQDAALEPDNRKLDMTPLHYAANKEHPEVVRRLLEYGADPNIQDSFGATPGHHAAMRGNLKILVSLVERGAKLDIRTSEGKSVSDIAAENEHQDVINYLDANPYLVITQKFLFEAMMRVKSELDMDVLMRRRAEGVDVRRYLISALRDLSIDVNSMLVEIGSGPVLEASSED